MSVVDRRGVFFLDTNIFVYPFDRSVPQKQAIAQQLIHEALETRRGIISTQVMQEFLNIALRTFARPFTVSESRDYLRMVLLSLCQHFPTADFYDRALLLQEETGFSFYDALAVMAAIETRCALLLSEDLQHGRTVRGVAIHNPFLSV
jgi:predicted nucleic acid-binding protein